MNLIKVCLFTAIIATPLGAQNHLADVARSMPVGTFALLNAEGDGSGWTQSMLFSGGSGVGSIMGFAGKAAYDPARDRVLFSGGEHGGLTKTIYYDVASNHWTDMGVIPMGFQYGHAYDTNAIDLTAQNLYASSTLMPNVRRMNVDSLAPFTVGPNPNFYMTEPSMEYFPDRDELLWLQGGWLGGLAKLDRSTDTWTTVSTQLSALQLRGAIARYIPSQHAVILIGGVNTDPMESGQPAVPSHAVYKYSADGSISRMKDFPSSIWMYPNHAIAVVDPVSSDLIIINSVVSGNLNVFTGDLEMWRYALAMDTWMPMDAKVIPEPTEWWQVYGSPFAVVTVPISTYGVTLFMSAAFGNQQSRIYVYKHSASIPPIEPPPDKTLLTVTGGAVHLKWTAVSNATEYRIERCSGATCTDFMEIGRSTDATYTDTMVPANATMRYRVRPIIVAPYTNTISVTFTTDADNVQPPSTSFDVKCAQSGVIACYGFNSSSNIRNMASISAAYPLKYGGWSGAGPCASAGLGTEYTYTQGRNSGTPTGAAEYNAMAVVQHGTCFYPSIDTSAAHSGSGALKIDIPSQSDARAGGYFDTPFQGLDQPFARVGPDNGGEIYVQYWFRPTNMVQDFGAAGTNTFVKRMIVAQGPPGLDYLGSDVSLSYIPISAYGFGTNRNGLIQSYGYDAAGNLQPTERNIDGTIYLQTGTKCVYSGAGPYSYPPCVASQDGQWQQDTLRMKLQAVASDFSVSGDTLRRNRTFESDMVGRWVYIVGDGFYAITTYVDADSVHLASRPSAGNGRTVYMSNYPNSIIQEWIGTTLVINVSDQRMAWDLNNAGWGQFRLQPHMTNKDASITHMPASILYDDLIVSTQPISLN